MKNPHLDLEGPDGGHDDVGTGGQRRWILAVAPQDHINV